MGKQKQIGLENYLKFGSVKFLTNQLRPVPKSAKIYASFFFYNLFKKRRKEKIIMNFFLTKCLWKISNKNFDETIKFFETNLP